MKTKEELKSEVRKESKRYALEESVKTAYSRYANMNSILSRMIDQGGCILSWKRKFTIDEIARASEVVSDLRYQFWRAVVWCHPDLEGKTLKYYELTNEVSELDTDISDSLPVVETKSE